MKSNNDWNPKSVQESCFSGDWINHINDIAFMLYVFSANNKGSSESVNKDLKNMLGMREDQDLVKLSGLEILFLTYDTETLLKLIPVLDEYKIDSDNIEWAISINLNLRASKIENILQNEGFDSIVKILNTTIQGISENNVKGANFKSTFLISCWLSKIVFSTSISASSKLRLCQMTHLTKYANDAHIIKYYTNKLALLKLINKNPIPFPLPKILKNTHIFLNDINSIRNAKSDFESKGPHPSNIVMYLYDEHFKPVELNNITKDTLNSLSQDIKQEFIIDILTCSLDVNSKNKILTTVTDAKEKLQIAQRISRRWELTDDEKNTALGEMFTETERSLSAFPCVQESNTILTIFNNIPLLAKFFSISANDQKPTFSSLMNIVIGKLVQISESILGYLAYLNMPFAKNINIVKFDNKNLHQCEETPTESGNMKGKTTATPDNNTLMRQARINRYTSKKNPN